MSLEMKQITNLQKTLWQDSSYFTLQSKEHKCVKAVVLHSHINAPAEDISDGRQGIGFSTLSVTQMTALVLFKKKLSGDPNALLNIRQES
jgi:hypothetical protein